MTVLDPVHSATAPKATRLGVIMQPRRDDPLEADGVLNPGAARGPDGSLYLFPRLVGHGNYSRIGIARVQFDSAGDPIGVKRLGIALEPQAPFERNANGGGCEDGRVTYVEPLHAYVMSYTALGSQGPRIALAISEDLFHWDRLGPVWFKPQNGVNFNNVPNKDGALFPVTMLDPEHVAAVAMVHRPLFPGTMPREILELPLPRVADVARESMWISYSPLDAVFCNRHLLCHFMSHYRLASPASEWERLKVGAGAPPVLTNRAFVMVYHGATAQPNDQSVEYSAGLIALDRDHGRTILYRTAEPLLSPETPTEMTGRVPRVIFPTGIDRRTDIGLPNRYDIYYGMADERIGVARLDLPDELGQ